MLHCPDAVLGAAEPDAGAWFGAELALDGGLLAVSSPHANPGGGVATGPATVEVLRHAGGGAWTILATLELPPPSGSSSFGRSVAVSDPLVAVGMPTQGGSGAAYVFSQVGGWVLEDELLPPEPSQGDAFGTAVDVDGEHLAVGAPWEDAPQPASGGAYIFRRTGSGAFVATAALHPPDPAEEDFFGQGVALDAGLLAVARPGDRFGSVHLYVLGAEGWVEEAKLAAVDVHWSSAIALDAGRLVVGVPDDSAQGFLSGSVLVYRRVSPGAWQFEARLLAEDGAAGDAFGTSVSISGELVAVGAPWNDGGGAANGAAYLFERGPSGWVQRSKLIPNVVSGGGRLGDSIALDGQSIVGGLPHTDEPEALNVGAALAFDVALALAPPALQGCPAELSVSAGGTHGMYLGLEPEYATYLYLLLGSASGTAPGFAVDGVHVPLALDAYTAFTAAQPNQAPLLGTFGVLDPHGDATLQLAVPAGTSATLAGVSLHHATLAFDLFSGGVVEVATNPVSVSLVR
ncbi:MAG TPA: FG-GAP repeat protein [Planctomycetota bacterium]|nr:FG-GAP repeat protein [Planctomycetota bacterium]